MRTTTAALVSTVLLSASVLTGCGGGSSSTDAYCKELKAAKSDFTALQGSTPDFNRLDHAISTFHDLAGKAPSEISAEWKTLDSALTTMEKALADAGLSIKDLGGIAAGNLPNGMTAEQLQQLAPKLQKAFGDLDNAKFTKASDKIEKHAKSTCHVDITG